MCDNILFYKICVTYKNISEFPQDKDNCPMFVKCIAHGHKNNLLIFNKYVTRSLYMHVVEVPINITEWIKCNHTPVFIQTVITNIPKIKNCFEGLYAQKFTPISIAQTPLKSIIEHSCLTHTHMQFHKNDCCLVVIQTTNITDKVVQLMLHKNIKQYK